MDDPTQSGPLLLHPTPVPAEDVEIVEGENDPAVDGRELFVGSCAGRAWRSCILRA